VTEIVSIATVVLILAAVTVRAPAHLLKMIPTQPSVDKLNRIGRRATETTTAPACLRLIDVIVSETLTVMNERAKAVAITMDVSGASERWSANARTFRAVIPLVGRIPASEV
jgi:hypothetical protein